jgi:hypothetical protein
VSLKSKTIFTGYDKMVLCSVSGVAGGVLSR